MTLDEQAWCWLQLNYLFAALVARYGLAGAPQRWVRILAMCQNRTACMASLFAPHLKVTVLQ